MRKALFLTLIAFIYGSAICQDDASQKAGLLLTKCPFDSTAEIMILKDEAELSVNNDFSLRLDRHVTFKFFKEKKIDKLLAEAIFYPTPVFEKYYRITLHTVELDPTTMSLIPRDYSSRVTSTHLDQMSIKVKNGALLEVSYSINYPYDEKIPDWRFQSVYPTEMSSLRILVPEVFNLKENLEGGFNPELNRIAESTKPFRLNNQTQTQKVSERFYQFNQLPSAVAEPFADQSRGQLERMHFHVISIVKAGDIKSEFAEGQVQHIIENLSTRADFLLRLSSTFEIKSDYDKRIR